MTGLGLGLGLGLAGQAQAADYAATVSALEPVAHYRFSNTNQIVEFPAVNQGSLGTDYNGSYQALAQRRGAPGALAGDADTSVSIDGRTGAQVVVPFSPVYNPSGPFTAEFWARPESNGGGTQTAVISMVNGQNAANGNDRSGWQVYHNGSSWLFRLGSDYADGVTFYHTTLEAPGTVAEGVWQHVVAVYTPALISLYVNGELVASDTPVQPLLPNLLAPLILGDRGYTGWDYTGDLDELAIYPAALSAADIAAHYANGTNANRTQAYPELVLQKAPALYLRLGEPSLTLPTEANLGSLGAVGNGTYYPGSALGIPGLQKSKAAGFSETNTAVYFDGVSGFVGTSLQELFAGPQFTVVAWFYPDGAQVNRTGVVGQNDVFEFGWHDAATQFGPWTPQGFPAANPSVIRLNQWNHTVVVADGVTMKLFLNGTEVASADSAWSGLTQAFNFNIGGGGILDTGGNFFRGAIDEVAVFDKALTIEEIQSVYNSALPAVLGITQSPAGAVFEGSAVQFSITTAGTGPFTYQWRKDGSHLTGRTQATLVLDAVVMGDAGEYDVVVTGGGATLTSPSVTLAVQASPPTITTPLASTTRFLNGTARFSAAVSGSVPLTYTWTLNGTTISGAEGSTLVLSDLAASDAGEYALIVSNPLGSVTNTATLTLVTPTKLAAAATALGPLGYWRLDETSAGPVADYWGGRDGTSTSGVTRGGEGPLPPAVGGFDAGNTAYTFSGTASEVQIPPLNMTLTELSIVAWIKPNGTQDNYDGLVFSRGPGTTSGLDYQTDGQLGYHWNDTAVSYNWGSGLYPVDATWNMVVLVVDPSTATIYMDSGSGLEISVNEAVHAPATFGGPFRFGADSSTARMFNGMIDDVIIYDRALTADEVESLRAAGYQGTAPNKPLAIVEQPKGRTFMAGSSYTLSVKATGSLPIGYQWQKDGVDIPGAIRSSLTLSDASVSDTGVYRAVVIQGGTSIPSSGATVTVGPVPSYVDLSEDLVLHLKFDGSYQDASGRNNHGTAVGSPTLGTGIIGTGALGYRTIVADGAVSTANYVTLGTPADLQFGAATSFSVSFWVRFTGSPGDLPFLANNLSSYGGPGLVLAPSYNTGSWSWSLNDGTSPAGWPGVVAQYGNDVGYANSLNDGEWHHLAFLVDRAGEMVTYQDGVRVHAKPLAGLEFNLDTGLALTIGQGADGAYPEAGSFEMDDLGIWRRALTDYDAQAIYVVGSNYGRSFDDAGPTEVVLGITKTATGVTLTWTTGTLESADSITGAWTTVTGATPPSYNATVDAGDTFYRVRVGN